MFPKCIMYACAVVCQQFYKRFVKDKMLKVCAKKKRFSNLDELSVSKFPDNNVRF